ncbi:Uncharacterised protein [Corynebacterium kutscheri]|uniref:Uncharacterized protein n=1 Tax=Corynebacterium kutscheri TaxID=35755 RepID=A0A0F6QZK9_9CORY|nr:hypothetical protein [Corynebacterium kutscheri]AKE41227.1 hypothetical protein UL82_05255 [Corynebacterium kutscheri]VEH08503.1 Uncharacterised protein [Corynebacterium kutscheri]VEH09549.1 Uncharacterised protein [Corynebacterium kutscheri]VEH79632.1 Uncharacterised protein [Corynebacterium kutscheri]
MNLSTQFRPIIDEFIANLETFATGSYLKEEEREFWEQPFDPAALPRLRALLEAFLSKVETTNVDETSAITLTTQFFTRLSDFNAEYADAVIEPEEQEEIISFVHQVFLSRGIEIEELPEFE